MQSHPLRGRKGDCRFAAPGALREPGAIGIQISNVGWREPFFSPNMTAGTSTQTAATPCGVEKAIADSPPRVRYATPG